MTHNQARKKAAEAEKQRPETAAAIAEMNRVALNDHTGGLHWYFYHTRPTDEFSFPSDRLEILRTIKAISTVADLRTLSIKSSHKAPEREDAINQINSPDSKADVLITSGRLSAFGVNYHNTFQNDILLKATENTATEIQMEGRLWRIGQSHCPVRSPSSGPFLVVQSIPPCPVCYSLSSPQSSAHCPADRVSTAEKSRGNRRSASAN
ncbi:hypothetical protein BN1708_002886 [Verticillium longisporum]|uniref:Helicase C-terminal domain-containing protein n=1 Tax=Verticillium longisporum TaxID=100787 RepID=A0A0G4L3P2_VERLO|nr:hypothetical protein BN1708_002886 [Verticillium longisporum]